MDYALNTDMAKAADKISSFIETSGKYIGVFTRAESVTSGKGTRGIEFTFKTNDGQTADYIQLWTHSKDGQPCGGPALGVVNALLTVLKLRGIKIVQTVIEKREQGKTVNKGCPIYPDLMNKQVGLILQREESFKPDGSTSHRMLLIAPFRADTELTAGEILTNVTQPVVLGNIVEWLSTHMVRHAKPKPGAGQENAYAAGGFGTQQPDPFDDDIPF